jgi:hypothetical protein
VSVESLPAVRQVAREIRQREHRDHAPGVLALYDVDLDPQFRYCLDTGRDPTPDCAFRTVSLSLPPAALAGDDPSALRVSGDPVDGGAGAVCEHVREALAARDPDVLVLSAGDLVPLLADAGIDLEYEGEFDWLAVCPRKRASGAALMRYFGVWAGEEGYKLRGVEARQRSTCAFVEASQRAARRPSTNTSNASNTAPLAVSATVSACPIVPSGRKSPNPRFVNVSVL